MFPLFDFKEYRKLTKINMEISKGPPILLSANLVAIVGSIVDGQPDFVTVAAIGAAASNPPALATALQPHRYSLKGIRQNMIFSVNIPSIDLVKETDYCGIVSGADADKVKDCKFQVFYGKSDKAPLIEQCPVNHVCEVIEILNLQSHMFVIGKIVETFISEDCLTDGKPDANKVKPFLFASRKYYGLGEIVGEPFKIGGEIKS
jgi:flavin reductase (DIM6/NTAB) family NADH-FMN oxidoreductase RutF